MIHMLRRGWKRGAIALFICFSAPMHPSVLDCLLRALEDETTFPVPKGDISP